MSKKNLKFSDVVSGSDPRSHTHASPAGHSNLALIEFTGNKRALIGRILMTAANYSVASRKKEEASCPIQACSSQQEGVCGG